MHFDDIWILALLLLLPLFYYRGQQKPALVYPAVGELKRIKPSIKMRLKRLPHFMKLLALVLVVIALARPQLVNQEREVSTKGTDIVLALDLSGSMMAEDFKPKNRLHVAKEVVKSFVAGRQSDRIGLVAFAGEAYTQSPLTLDYGILVNLIESLEMGRYKDGTAIGMAVAEGVKRLKDSGAETRLIILLTDGENNSGNIDPVTAAKVAKAMGVKVYTVGVGKKGGAPIPVYSRLYGKVYARDSNNDLILTRLNEAVLKEVAEVTGAKYYRATDKASLIQIYEEIDSLEKTEIKVKEYYSYKEIYSWFLAAAMLLMVLSTLLRSTWLWSYP